MQHIASVAQASQACQLLTLPVRLPRQTHVQEAVDLMLQCMSFEPAERPTALQAMQRLAAMQQQQQQRPKLRELAAPPTA